MYSRGHALSWAEVGEKADGHDAIDEERGLGGRGGWGKNETNCDHFEWTTGNTVEPLSDRKASVERVKADTGTRLAHSLSRNRSSQIRSTRSIANQVPEMDRVEIRDTWLKES